MQEVGGSNPLAPPKKCWSEAISGRTEASCVLSAARRGLDLAVEPASLRVFCLPGSCGPHPCFGPQTGGERPRKSRNNAYVFMVVKGRCCLKAQVAEPLRIFEDYSAAPHGSRPDAKVAT